MTLTCAPDNHALNVFPVGMQNSALVLQDEDGTSVTDLAEYSNSSESSLAPAAINIEHSSDVIIGPVTQFHGPVTIYQNVNGSPAPIEDNPAERCQNGKLVKSDSTSSDGPHPSDKSTKSLPYSKNLIYVGISLILFVIVVIVAIATILALNPKKDPLKDSEPHHDDVDHDVDDDVDHDVTDDPGDVVKPLGPGAIIEKRLWGGRPALNFTVPLRHPIHLVIIAHTATPRCKDFIACSKRVQSIQNYHVAELKSPDIGYNFVVGGDGNAYVGRGWDIKNFHQPGSVSISFIGNYVYDYLTPGMIDVTKKLLEEGVRKGKLAKDYILVGHNQTYNTQSPGIHVYEVIKTWPHFDPKIYYH